MQKPQQGRQPAVGMVVGQPQYGQQHHSGAPVPVRTQHNTGEQFYQSRAWDVEILEDLCGMHCLNCCCSWCYPNTIASIAGKSQSEVMGMQFHSLQKVMWAAFIGSLIIEWLTTVSYFDAHGFVYVSYSPFGFIYYFFLAYIIFSLRGLVREKNGISGNVSEDLVCSVCCAPCTINQLAHQTDILQHSWLNFSLRGVEDHHANAYYAHPPTQPVMHRQQPGPDAVYQSPVVATAQEPIVAAPVHDKTMPV